MISGSWLPEGWSKTTVLIEECRLEDSEKKYFSVGTGFLIDYQLRNILVTCKHIVEGKKYLYTAFNLKDGNITRRSLESIKSMFEVDWVFHKNEDIAMIIFGIDTEKDDLLRIPNDLIEDFKNTEIGDDIFFLGYPLGIKPLKKFDPLVRAGIISMKEEKDFVIIEGNAFPGSSGSPVFLKPSIFNLKAKTIGQIRDAKFIGMLTGYIPYTDVAISQQTGKPRLIFEENSGLAKVLSTNLIREIFEYDSFKKYIDKLKVQTNP